MDGDEWLLARARRLREEAHALPYDEGLFDLISAVGPTRVRGGVDLDLMIWPDVDVSVRLPRDEDVSTFFDLGKAIAVSYPAFKMNYSRHSIRPDVPFDWGLYWGVRFPHAEEMWKLDLWGVGEEDFFRTVKEHEALKRRLEDVDRLTVLRIKDHARRRPDYPGGHEHARLRSRHGTRRRDPRSLRRLARHPAAAGPFDLIRRSEASG